MTSDQAQRETRARILWGDSREVVTAYLREHDVEAGATEQFIQAAQRERGEALMKIGRRKVGRSAGYLAAALAGWVVLDYFSLLELHDRDTFYAIVPVGFGAIGLWTLVHGGRLWLNPRGARGNVGARYNDFR